MACSRRQFLGTLAAGAVGAAAAAGAAPSLLRWGLRTAAAGEPGGLPAAISAPRSKLLSIANRVVVKGTRVSENQLGRMLAVGISRFCDVNREKDAWAKLIKPDEKVLIKFNRSGADAIATTEPLVKVLLASMATAGLGPGQIMLLDVTADVQRKSGTVAPILGYQDQPVTVLSRAENLAAALAWADCLINVPFIKDHHLAGVTCGMKNLSHGLIKTPARWHGDRCRESIPRLFALPAIQSKLRLTLCNALRIVVDGGPGARQETIAEHNRLLFASDVVALDAYAARAIDQARGARGLHDLAEERRFPIYLNVARDLRLGQSDLERIDLAELDI